MLHSKGVAKVVLEDVIDDIVTVNQTLTMVVTPINN